MPIFEIIVVLVICAFFTVFFYGLWLVENDIRYIQAMSYLNILYCLAKTKTEEEVIGYIQQVLVSTKNGTTLVD